MKIKLLSWLLFASLMVNATLGGFLIARSAKRHGLFHHEIAETPLSGASGLLRRLVSVMGGPRNERFQRLKAKQPLDISKFRKEMMEAQAQVHRELGNEAFSRERFEQAVHAMEVLEIQGIRRANELALRLAPEMTPKERLRAVNERREPGKPRLEREHRPRERK